MTRRWDTPDCRICGIFLGEDRAGICDACKHQRDQLVLQWQYLPAYVAKSLWSQAWVRNTIGSIDDLVSLGWEPLIRSAEVWLVRGDPAIAKFNTYATNAIFLTVSREIHRYRSTIYIPASVVQDVFRMSSGVGAICPKTARLGAVAMGRSCSEVVEEMLPYDDEEDVVFERLHDAIRTLGDADQQLVEDLFWSNMNCEQAGRHLGISRQSAQLRRLKILKILKERAVP